jgi:hypothetical protein
MRIRRVSIPSLVSDNTLHAFFRLYEFERWLREMVYTELKTYYGADWLTEVDNAIKRSGKGGIPAARSLQLDKRHQHMTTQENDPLWYLSFEVLQRIVFDRKLWRRFQPYLTTKKLLRAKLDEISPVRNRVAHGRELHPEDVPRIERVLRDLDQGFWKFCGSYNRCFYLSTYKKGSDELYQYIASKLKGGRSAVDITPLYSFRPSISPRRRSVPGRGGVYYLAFVPWATPCKYMDYAELLAFTSRSHKNVLHIMLDSSQRKIILTLPAVLPMNVLRSTVDDFHEACSNVLEHSPSKRLLIKGPRKRKNNSLRGIEERNRRFEQFAAEWPHYVLPPSHPFAILAWCPPIPSHYRGDFFTTGQCIF